VPPGSGADDIYVIYGESNRVERNLVTENGDDGIEIFINRSGTTLSRNSAYNNGDLGIEQCPTLSTVAATRPLATATRCNT
jgi:parallel beta-helix repeat protein